MLELYLAKQQKHNALMLMSKTKQPMLVLLEGQARKLILEIHKTHRYMLTHMQHMIQITQQVLITLLKLITHKLKVVELQML